VAGIGIVNNPRSKRNIKNPGSIRKLGYLLGDKGESKTTGSLLELDDCLRGFLEKKIDILAINGGDGSNQVALHKLIEIQKETGAPMPMIAFLRGGTLNTIARGFNIKGSPESILANIARKYGEGFEFETVTANVLKIDGRHGFLFGNGLIANFMNTYYTTGKPSPAHGVLTMLKGVASALTGTQLSKDWFKKIEARVTVEGVEIPVTHFTSILAATIKDIGVGFQPFYRAFEELDSFHVLFYTCTPMEFAAELPYIYMARPIRDRMGTETLAKHVTIEAKEPFHYTLDGDMYVHKSGKMDIEIGPRLTVIVR
jgi:diacylglycerol kinase family enzyme